MKLVLKAYICELFGLSGKIVWISSLWPENTVLDIFILYLVSRLELELGENDFKDRTIKDF